MKKRVLSFFLAAILIVSLLPVSVFAADFSDIQGHWAESSIVRWSEYGIIVGSNGKFDPNGTLTRAQMATILSRLLALPKAKSANFSDVKETDWYAPYIDRCFAAEIMLGSDGKAQPNDPITREQAIVMLGRALGIKPIENPDLSVYADAATVSDWAKGYVAAMAAAGIVNGTSATTVSPKASIDRAATVTILDRAVGTYANVDGAEVTAADSGIILIAADNVRVTGAAKGAIVIVSPSADGVTVNGASVAAGTTTTAVEKKRNKPISIGGGGSDPTPSTPPTGNDLTISESKTVVGGTYHDVIITAAVGNGDVTLDNVTIKGELKVQGGGSNSIHLESCTVDTIKVDKDTNADGAQQPRIELNNTPVETIKAEKPVIIEADADSAVGAVDAKSDVTVQGENTTVQNVTAAAENVKLTVKDAAVEKVTAEKPVTIEATSEASTIKEVEAQSDVTVQGAATKVDKVTVPESAADTGVELKIEGAKVTEVAAEKPITIEATAGASPIEKVEAKDDLTVKGEDAQIEQVEVPNTATKQPTIDVQSGTVTEVKADQPAEVKGSGTVTNVTANAAVEVASETVTTITVTVQVTVTVTGDQPIEVAVETTQNVNISAQNATVAVSTTQTTEVSVQVNNQAVTHVHKWNETSRTPATCSDTGSVTYTCVGAGTCELGNTKTEILPMIPHKEKILPAVAATCTKTGLTAGKVCAVCETVLVEQKATAATGHHYAETWSSDSEGHWHECLNCGDSMDFAAHTPGAKATETTDQTCTVCGYVIAPSTGHRCTNHLTKTAARAATCTAAGNSEYYTCTCGKYYSDASAKNQIEADSWVINATGHNYDAPSYEWKAVSGGYTCTATRVCANNENHKETETVTASYAVTTPATCKAVGSGTYTATFTNTAFAEQKKVVEIAKLLHTEVIDEAVAATCTENGKTEGKHCSVCDEVITAQQNIPALGHNWATEWSNDETYHWHVCTRDGCETVDGKTEHTPGAAATETTAQICIVCDYELAPALGHVCKNHLTKHDAVSATCETAGNSEYYTCTCGKYYSDANAENEITENSWVLSALGHNWATEWSNDETYHWHECRREGCTAIDDKAEHSWNEGIVTTPATGTQNGVKTYTCTICGAEKTEVISATNVVVMTYDAFVNALNDPEVPGITLNADITIPAQDHWEVLTISKPVFVAAGKTLTVAGYTTDGDKFGFLANDLTVVEDGSLTLGENAVLKTTAIKSGENEPFYNYTGRVCVSGGTLDVSAGTVADGSFFNFNYVENTLNSNALILGENKPEIEFSVHNDAELRAAIADGKCTGGVIVEDNITLENDLAVTKLVLVNDQWTLTVPAGKTLTVAEGGTLQISGTLNVYGTLNNEGKIFNLHFIDVLGGTLSNSGVINGSGWPDENGQFFYASNIGVENGAIINNFIGEKRGTLNDCIAVADYYREGEAVKQCRWNVLEGDHTFDPVFADGRDNPNFDVMAVGFGTKQTITALNAMSYWGDGNEQHSAYTYEYVVACGTDPENENTVELGGITVRPFATLILKAEVFDGTNIYRNKYVISEGETLTLEKNSALAARGESELVINGNYVDNGAYIDMGAFTLSGENAPVIVHSEEELTAALAKGGKIIIEGTDEFVQNTDDGRIIVLDSAITVSKDTEFVNQFGHILYIPGLTVSKGVALTVSNMTVVLAADSTVSGTLNIGGNCFVMVRTPDEATEGEITELTVTEGGRIVIGGEDESFWNAQLGNAEGENGGRLVNNGTIDVYGDLWFDNVGGTVNYKFIAEVESREELLAAMNDPVVRNVIFKSDVILRSGDAFQGRGMCYEIPEGVKVTLDWDEDHNDGMPIFLLQGATLRVNGVLDVKHAFYAYAGIETPENEPRENHIQNEEQIHYMRNFADFGEFVCNAVGDRLAAITNEEIRSYGDQDIENWPGGEWNERFFAFLVKYGGVEALTDESIEGRVYWPTWEPINYGQAKAILEKVWKAINDEQSNMPASVSLSGVMDDEPMDDGRINELLRAFAVALPRITDDTTTSFTLIRDNVRPDGVDHTNDGMTITGKTFTEHITITCDPQYLNGDGFGGELKFMNCEFAAGVTVKMTDDVNFKVDFGNSCTGNAVIELPDEKTLQQCRDNRTNVELYYVSGMSFDTTNAFGDFNDWGHDETVSFTLNGLTITDEGEGAFGINARYDENGRDNENQPIFIPTVEVTVFAQANEVEVSGGYSGKLRIRGNVDVSGLTLENGGFIELNREGSGSNIDLGNNTIFVNNDCGGEYSFTGTGTVIVRDQNRNARITVNDVYLDIPHIFGEHGEKIFFPLASSEGVEFTVEQGQWNEEAQCAEGWTELEYAVETKEDGSGIHLRGAEGKKWINDPYQVRVTVTVDGCTVVYDTIMWKPVQIAEFVDALNYALGTKYAFHDDIDESWEENDYLTYDMAKKVIDYVKANYEGAENIGIESIITDENYWSQLDDWRRQYAEAENNNDENWLRDLEGSNPDNWTWDWFFANDVIGKLKSTLGIKDTYGDVELHVSRDDNGENVNLKDSNGEWRSFDGNQVADCRFTGTVTVVCDTERSENDDFGGCVFFENCDFTNGAIVELKNGVNYGVRFYNCTGTVLTIKDGEATLAPLTLGGSNIAVDVRYDECDRDEIDQPIYIATAEIRSEDGSTVTVSGNGFNGKLRTSGNADVSDLSFGENGWLELSNNGDSSIALGKNDILVNPDCGGSYSFIGTGTVSVPNQNQSANITVNGKNLGTPHMFGRDNLAIFFPLQSAEGLTFTVEQGQWNEEAQCAEGWTELEYAVETKEDGSGIHLRGAEGKKWINDPYQVRVTVKVDGCTVVYDTMMWKPVQMDEFIEELNERLGTNYTLEDLELPENGDLTIGACKTAFETVLRSASPAVTVEMTQIINDDGYWDELERWTEECGRAKESNDENWIRDMENRTPDRWTKRWNDLDMMLDELTKALSISAPTPN